MAKFERRETHAQAAHLIAQAVDRWRAAQELERSLQGETESYQEVA